MSGTPIIGDIIDLLLWLIEMTMSIVKIIAQYSADIFKFLWSTFRFDRPEQLLALSMIFLILIVCLLGLFGGVAVYISGEGPGKIKIGSDAVATGTGAEDFGGMFHGQGAALVDFESEQYDPGQGSVNTEYVGTQIEGVSEDMESINLCGNTFCDSFPTPAKIYVLDGASVFAGCTDEYLIYDIPSYCFGEGLKTYVLRSWAGDTVFKNAVCGRQKFYSVVSERCMISNGSIWYVETPVNYILDCDRTSCEIDLTCLDDPLNCDDSGMCCPGGTLGEYRCVDYGDIQAICNNPGTVWLPLETLRRGSFHCPCLSDASCVGDEGGSTCCHEGTYHAGFCYQEALCDSP